MGDWKRTEASLAAHEIARGLGTILRWSDESGPADHFEEGVDMLTLGIKRALTLLVEAPAMPTDPKDDAACFPPQGCLKCGKPRRDRDMFFCDECVANRPTPRVVPPTPDDAEEGVPLSTLRMVLNYDPDATIPREKILAEIQELSNAEEARVGISDDAEDAARALLTQMRPHVHMHAYTAFRNDDRRCCACFIGSECICHRAEGIEQEVPRVAQALRDFRERGVEEARKEWRKEMNRCPQR